MKENKYDDIINLPRHISEKHPHMSVYDRAAQFSPFAALTGHDAAIIEQARLTREDTMLAEDKIQEIAVKLTYLQQNLKNINSVKIIYFTQDKRKSGGNYTTEIINVKKIDDFNQKIILIDGRSIAYSRIKDISFDTDI